jgi:dynein heavy chain
MKSTIRAVLLHSVEDYVKNPRKEWVKRHPGQCVLNGSQVHWTLEVEEAMKDGYQGVKKYWETKLEAQLKELVVLVRTKLSKQVKVAINALIVIDVHAKDVVENLWRNEISELNSFEWIS